MSTAIPARSSSPATDPVPQDAISIPALHSVIFGEDPVASLRMRDRVAALGDRPDPGPGHTIDDRLRTGYGCLQRISRELGGSRALAADVAAGVDLCEWAAQLAPHLMPFLTGHLDLAVGTIARLTNGAPYQLEALTDLDGVDAVGVMALTEIGHGTHAVDLETRAEWRPDPVHPDGGWFDLHTPRPEAAKQPPNVGLDGIAKIGIVLARMIAFGRDEGVWPFLVRLRTPAGPVDGVTIHAMTDNRHGPVMDHATVTFDHLRIPADAWLRGDLARLDGDRFECALDHRQRLGEAISELVTGRVKLGRAATASSRAALALTVGYAPRRRLGDQTLADLDTVQRDLVTATAAAYAMSALGHHLTGALIADDPVAPLLAMLGKPLLVTTARATLDTCRLRLGAQGTSAANYLPAWIANANGMTTAEGDDKALLAAAGHRLAATPAFAAAADTGLWRPENPDEVPWWQQMLHNRQRTMLAAARRDDPPRGIVAVGAVCEATALALAVAQRLAVDSLAAAAARIPDPPTRALVNALTAIQALTTIHDHAHWYAAHDQYQPEVADTVDSDLVYYISIVADQLPVLTQAFGLPLLTAPLAHPDYAAKSAAHYSAQPGSGPGVQRS
ncbi:acyl-CoA dehydrogenase family protein [Nocardia sp. alder85J]|uniref:acyl-CoA dehydrogenase family protein n=1 Tax=Nocardia sp. alder85J TaxID=2862949 RepID=UPI001CD44FC8|nr:acyl-CoA dehydrogenase family protein [Nocardia sp. alder85J]MCX4097689.1 acyl-CoA dehydrogenase family protein [Nocardia sp. alder85J]